MGKASLLYIIPGVLGFAIVLFFIGLANYLTSGRRQIEDRLEQHGKRDDDYTYMTGDEDISLFGEEEEETRGGPIARWLQKRAKKNNSKGTITLRDELARADLKLKIGEWQMIQIVSVIVMGIIGLVVFFQPILAIVVSIVGFFIPGFYLRNRQKQRLAAFEDRLSDAIVMMSNSLRAGYSFLQSLEVVGQEMPDPIGVEFGRVVREIGLGLTQEQGLANLFRRIPSGDLDMMITAVNVQQEVGGNLAEILDTLAHTIRERVRIQGEIRVLVAQQKMAGYIITGLPIALAAFLSYMNPAYIGLLYSEPCGWMMIAASIIMITAGFFAIQKIVDIEI